MGGFVSFVLLIGAALLVWHFVFFLVPAIERARFVHEASALRDDLSDALLYGEVQDSAEARHLLRKYESFGAEVEQLSLMHVAAVVSSLHDAGLEPKHVARSFPEVSDHDREYLDHLEKQMVSHLARRIVRGSPFWFPLLLIQAGMRMGRRISLKMTSPVSPYSLAGDFSGAADSGKVRALFEPSKHLISI